MRRIASICTEVAAIRRFEDLEAWGKARVLAASIYSITSTSPFAQDFSLRDQIRRAAISVMSNIAEGFDRGGQVEFRRFLGIAKGSAAEVRAQLYVAFDVGLLTQTQFDDLVGQSEDVTRLIAGLIRHITATQDST